MATFLFVCRPHQRPEEVGVIPNYWWSCSSTTRCGDRAIVYVTGIGFRYEWECLSDAEPHPEWRYVCDVGPLRAFEPAIELREVCQAVDRDEWPPPHLNFRGYSSLVMPELVANRIRKLRLDVSPIIQG